MLSALRSEDSRELHRFWLFLATTIVLTARRFDMKRWFVGAIFALFTVTALAVQPYVSAAKVTAGDLKTAMAAVEQKLAAGGFVVIGRHMPKGLPDYGVVVVTDSGLTEALKQLGGTAVIGIPIRVGVKNDGTVSYENLEYWERGYIRNDYSKIEAATKAADAKLEKALGADKLFGGDIKAADLPKYHYMFGMEYFDDRSLLKEYGSFDEAVKVVRDNLAKGVAHTSKVYEVVIPEKKIAVFGVATNDPNYGESWWVAKIGAGHIAALPWEVFVVDKKVMALYGRFRTALAWPQLGMGEFMSISNHPDTTMKMMQAVAGVAE